MGAQSYPLNHAERILLQAFSAPRSSEAYLVAEGAVHQHEREFAAMRSDVRAMVEQLRNRPDGGDPLAALVNNEQRQMLAEMFLSIHDAEPEADEVDAAVLAIRRQAIEHEQRQLRVELEKAERARNAAEVMRLTHATQDTSRRLRDLD
jgi:DNA primase